MTEKEKEREKKKEEGYRFLTLRVKTEWTYIYLHASQHHQKRKEKASRFYPTSLPYLLPFFFHSLRQDFFFSIFFGIGSCMYAYLTLLKVCA